MVKNSFAVTAITHHFDVFASLGETSLEIRSIQIAFGGKHETLRFRQRSISDRCRGIVCADPLPFEKTG